MTTKLMQQKLIDRLTLDDGTNPSGVIFLGSAVVATPPEHNSWNGLAQGGVWGQPIKQYSSEDPDGATREAFSYVGYIRPCVFVKIAPAIPHAQADDVLKGIVATANFSMYAGSHDSGKLSLEAMRQRIEQLMDQWYFTTDIYPGENNGPRAFPRFSFWQGPEDNHQEFRGSKIDVVRYDITTLRSL
jgi:hypothetical protein